MRFAAFALLIGLAPIAASEAKVTWNFPGGNLGRVETAGKNHLRLHLAGEKDQDGRNRQANWYSFQVDAEPGVPLVLDLVSLPGEYNYKPNRGAVTADTPPVISMDRREWRHIQTFEYDPAEPRMRLRIVPTAKRFWIAHVPPYTGEDLDRLRKDAGPAVSETVAGRTVDGRPMPLWTIGSGPRTVWLFFRQHSWEAGSSWVGDGLVRFLASVEGESLRRSITWKIFPMCDPDGVARGGVRFNRHGFDLNRNWDVSGVERMPEITAQRAAVRQWVESGKSIDLLFSLHNTETAEYLEGPPGGGPDGRYRPLAEAFFATLSEGTSFAPTRPLYFAQPTTTAGMPGRMTIIQGLFRDFGVPGFLMEQRISKHPKYGRLPLAEDRLRFGRELAVTIGRVVAP